ncbi:hypothetical protein Tco_1201197 [Tanacetum coccineum]
MGDENPIRTLGDYSKPSHEGYRNTIKLPVGNNVQAIGLNVIRRIHQPTLEESHDLLPFPCLQIISTPKPTTSEGLQTTAMDILCSNNIMENLYLKHGLCEIDRPNPQPQALGTTFEARVQDYMAAHTERMERFKNAIFKQREELNDSD